MCNAGENETFNILKQILRRAADFDPRHSPPEMAMYIHRIIRTSLGCTDPYKEIKHKAIQEVLKYENDIRARISNSSNPLYTAIRFALVGNVLDFAIFDWNPSVLAEQLENAMHKDIDKDKLSILEQEINKAASIMVIGDNAGESVFDKLLIEQLRGRNRDIVYVVKGVPVINDVTLNDAVDSGFDESFRVIDNGSDVPGTLLKYTSEAFLSEFYDADLVIAKGQGNYESLCDCDRKVFFLTQVKCPVIARDLDYKIGDWVIAETHN
eukprot:TRINITY_DN3779_c0_g2_i2.p1 TRINITY_DN3779_c0_g2~~TRINITY_DN3779_c0_g2_i2.p1  ORF type:complete len:267 (-),score=8.85 TRINITY_DN3779_c0_g2_i2:384-1184(-)